MSREAKIGMAISVVLGLVLGIPFYVFGGSLMDPTATATKQTTPQDVVQALRDEDLPVGESHDLEEDPEWGTGMIPKTMDAAVRFEIPGHKSMGETATGDVYHFATPEDQRVLKGYFETVGQSGMFYTHIYENGSLTLKIDGHVPKATADKYNEVFQRL